MADVSPSVAACMSDMAAEILELRARLAAVRRALDDEIANLADDGARLSHAVVRRIEAIIAGDRAEAVAHEFTPARGDGLFGCSTNVVDGMEFYRCGLPHDHPVHASGGAAGDDRG